MTETASQNWQISLAILAALSTSLALAEDFKTIDGKEYKNAKVSRVEPDGLVLITKSGISKVYFTELPKEVQERFHYDAGGKLQCCNSQIDSTVSGDQSGRTWIADDVRIQQSMKVG
jgi:hypothetical protein